ncbi:hypothetical protein Tco_1547690 [Tanacetum coccineum]
MRTRSSNRRRSRQQEQQQLTPVIVEVPEIPMADNRIMAELLQAPTGGFEDAIVIHPFQADNFELKPSLITLVQSNKFSGDGNKMDPHGHIRYFEKITNNFRYQTVPSTTEMDIQEKDKNKAEKDKTEHGNEKSMSKSQSQSQIEAKDKCSSYGVVYTADFCCLKKGLEDKILVPKSPQNCARCARCGTPVNGPYCQECALLRKKFKEDLFTYCVENEFFKDLQDTSESSDDNTNVVNAPQEPFVGNQDPGENSSPSPSQIDHCCYECGDSLDGIFYRQCTYDTIAITPEAAKDRSWKIPICYDDDEDNTIAITPVLPIEEPDNSLSMGDEHLDTIPEHGTDEFIKPTFKEHSETIIDSNDDSTSSDDDSPYGENIDYVDASPPDDEIVSLEVVEIVNPEVGRIDDDILLTIKDDILREKLSNVNLLIAKIDALRDNPTPSSEVMIKSTSTFPNLFLEEANTFDNSIPESETFRFNLEEIGSGSPITHSELSLPDFKAFYIDNDHFKERSSGSTTTHVDFSQYDSFIFDLSINPIPPADRSDFYHEKFADELAHIISPLEYDCFCFKIEPELGNLTMDVVNDIFPTREPRVHVPNVLPTHPTLDLDFILLSEPLFAYIVWIFLPFLTYPVAPPYLLSCGNEDTIFDPGISIYHPFMPGVSHRSGTFMKFNDFPDCEDSRFCPSLELHILSFILGIQYPNLID